MGGFANPGPHIVSIAFVLVNVSVDTDSVVSILFAYPVVSGMVPSRYVTRIGKLAFVDFPEVSLTIYSPG
jgi:hypothetical protein